MWKIVNFCQLILEIDKMNKNSGEQEKESIIRGRKDRKIGPFGFFYHHSASLVMPNSDPKDGFFYPTLPLIIDFFILS